MGTQRITDLMSDLGNRARGRVTRSKLDRLDRDNDRLRGENAVLRDDLRAERNALQEAMKHIHERSTVTVKGRRRPRILRTAAIAAGAYVLGTKAGRERYEEIVGRAHSLRRSIRRATEEDRGWDEDGRPEPGPLAAVKGPDTTRKPYMPNG
jgi:hypothetical protein